MLFSTFALTSPKGESTKESASNLNGPKDETVTFFDFVAEIGETVDSTTPLDPVKVKLSAFVEGDTILSEEVTLPSNPDFVSTPLRML
jgi:hypothetical protein